MKFEHHNHSNPQLATSSYLQHRPSSAGANEYRVADALLMIGVVAAIIALYAAMFVGLYRWSHYDPLLPDAISAIPCVSESSM